MELSLTQELDKIRAAKRPVDISRGMAVIYGWHNHGTGFEWEAIGIFTVVFAEAWCNDDPGYRWERI